MPDAFFICTRGRRRRCWACGSHGATRLCDGVRRHGKSGTCDRPLCVNCATSRPDPRKRGDTIDLCPSCAQVPQPEQLPLEVDRG